uniref:Cadherin 4 n=1 Tax=Mus musculus TaxID=10090 RepID=F6QV10_MOUSE
QLVCLETDRHTSHSALLAVGCIK